MSTTEQPMGVALFDEGRWGIRYERRLAHPPEKVWRALTEPEHVVHWLPIDIVGERRAGAPIELRFLPGPIEKYDLADPVLHGEIRVWDPPRVFEWTWDTDLLRWELQADGEHTVLTFTTWFGEAETEVAAGAGAGYHICLDELRELLDTGTVEPLDEAIVPVWEARYTDAISAVVTASG